MLIITKPSKAPVIENLKFNYQHKNRKCGIKKEVDFRFSAPLYDLKNTRPASPIREYDANLNWRGVLCAQHWPQLIWKSLFDLTQNYTIIEFLIEINNH